MIVDQYHQGCTLYGITPNGKPVAEYWLNKEHSVTIGDYNLEIINTSGHTPGGICYKLNGDIFTGDTLFKGSIGRTDLPGGNYNSLMKSLKLLIEKVPAKTRVHSGHGSSTTIQNEILSNPFLMKI